MSTAATRASYYIATWRGTDDKRRPCVMRLHKPSLAEIMLIGAARDTIYNLDTPPVHCALSSYVWHARRSSDDDKGEYDDYVTTFQSVEEDVVRARDILEIALSWLVEKGKIWSGTMKELMTTFDAAVHLNKRREDKKTEPTVTAEAACLFRVAASTVGCALGVSDAKRLIEHLLTTAYPRLTRDDQLKTLQLLEAAVASTTTTTVHGPVVRGRLY